MRIEFEVDGKKISRSLDLYGSGIKDFRVPFNQVGASLMKTFDTNFSTRGAVYGRWKPRKPQFRAGARIDTWPLLEKSGRLRRGFERRVDTSSLVITNLVRHFPYHQEGTSRLPKRVMMSLRAQDGRMVIKTFQEHAIYAMRKAGLR